MADWDCFYRSAYNEDGSLFFPERLTHEFLNAARKHQGSQFFANQYLNKVIDEGALPFNKKWLRYYDEIPDNAYRFIMIDPAISQSDAADFTAVVVVAVDCNKQWYLEHASKHKITPTQIMSLLFQLAERFVPMKIGLEDVAFQKVLIYMAYEKMEEKNRWLPLEGVKPPNDKTKHMKILGLVPMFEWGRILINHNLFDFEEQYEQYAGERSKHDDILDALASIHPLVTYPTDRSEDILEVSPNHPDYEHFYRLKLMAGKINK